MLVRSRLGTLYVLKRKEGEVFSAQAVALGEKPSELVLESDDRDELVRFKELAREED